MCNFPLLAEIALHTQMVFWIEICYEGKVYFAKFTDSSTVASNTSRNTPTVNGGLWFDMRHESLRRLLKNHALLLCSLLGTELAKAEPSGNIFFL